jgi:hypothetical protein
VVVHLDRATLDLEHARDGRRLVRRQLALRMAAITAACA